MFCKNCGKELIEGSKFCPYCGIDVNPENVVVEETPEVVSTPEVVNEPEVVEVPKVWKVFAKISKIFGIISISTCWIPVLGLYMWMLSIPGIVFAALGRKGSKDPVVNSQSKVGLILSILSTVLAFVLYILFAVVLGVIIGLSEYSSSYGSSYYYY